MGNEQSALEHSELVLNIARDNLKGIPKTQIAKKYNISPVTLKKYLEEYDEYISSKVADNPEILEQFLENVFLFDEQFSTINTEIWDVIDKSSENDVMSTKLAGLKLAKDLVETKAKMYQVMSPRLDSGYIERMRRIEKVNSILSSVIRDVVGPCPRCGDLAWRRLEEAFRIGGVAEDMPENNNEEENDEAPMGELKSGNTG